MSIYDKGTVAASAIVSRAPDLSGNFVCDGTADEVQIAAALAYVTALGGGEVVLLDGTYEIAVSVTIPANILFRGVGYTTIINYTTVIEENNWALILGGNYIKVRDFKVTVPDGVGYEEYRPSLMYIVARTGCEVDRIWFEQDDTASDEGYEWTQDCLDTENCVDLKIRDCHFQDSLNYNVYVITTSQLWYSGNHSENGYNGSSLRTITRGTVTDNIHEEELSSGNGTYVSICNNSFKRLLFSSCDYCVISGNTLETSGDGLYCDAGTYNVISGNTIFGSNGDGIYLTTQANYNTITGNTITGSAGSGIQTINCLVNTIVGNTFSFNVQHGIEIDCSVANQGYGTVITGNICEGNGTGGGVAYDGINLDGYCHETLISNNQCNDNDRYGINLEDANSTNNRVKDNIMTGNTTGAFNDIGTDTKLATKTFSFIAGGDLDGTALWANYVSATASAKGWEVDDAADWAQALGQLPLELQQIVRFKIWAVALGAPIGGGGHMHLEINMNAGASNLAYTTEPVALANFNGEEADYVATDVVHWIVDSGDDADIGSMVGGMSIEIEVIYEDGDDPDGATNAVFRTVEVEYV